MSIEIEKKFKLTRVQFDEMRKRLHEAGAEFESSCFECNSLFSDARLRQIEAYVRIRQTDNRATLTYKRLLPPTSDLKTQIEIESGVADPDAVAKILCELGLKLSILYEKERETWQLGSAEVVLDRLPFGFYMEIEGTVEAIGRAEELIVSDEIPTESSSYPKLTSENGTLSGEVFTAVFPREKSEESI